MSARGLSCTRWRRPRPFGWAPTVAAWAVRGWVVVGWLVLIPLAIYLRSAA